MVSFEPEILKVLMTIFLRTFEKAYVTHVDVKLVDKMQVEDYMFKVLSSILQKSAHKCSNLTVAKAMMRFLNSTRSGRFSNCHFFISPNFETLERHPGSINLKTLLSI